MHVDVDRISACALGELPDPEQQAVLEHCKKCAHCGDQLAAAMLLAIAADEPAYMSHAARTSVLRHWPAAATVIVAVALLAWASASLSTRIDPTATGGGDVRPATDIDDVGPAQSAIDDRGIRRDVVWSTRWDAEGVTTPYDDPAMVDEILSANSMFGREEYAKAIAKLTAIPRLPEYGEELLGASYFFSGQFESAENIFKRTFVQARMDSGGFGWDSASTTASYFLARIYYSTGQNLEARRWARVAAEAFDRWKVPGQLLVEDRLGSLFASRSESQTGRRVAENDEDLRLLLMERARYLYPEDLPGRGWPWETGVPPALDEFDAGRFAEAAIALAAVAPPKGVPARGFHRTLLGISLYYAGDYEDAAGALEADVGGFEEIEERPAYWGFSKDASAYYLARLYAQAGRIDDARRLATIVSEGTSAWTPAAQMLINDLS